MSASMLNLSALAGPVQPGAAGKAGAAAQGPLAGFEALMAAFFGAQAQGDAAQLFAPQAAQAMAGAAVVAPTTDGKPAEAEAGDAADAPKTEDAAAATLGDNLALLAALVVPAPAQPIVQAVIQAVVGGADPTPAAGQDKAAAPQQLAVDPDALFDPKAAGDAAQPVPAGQAKPAAQPQAAVQQAAIQPPAAPPPAAQTAAQPQAVAAQAAVAPTPVQTAEAAPPAPAPAPVKEKASARGERTETARPAAGRTEAFAAAGAQVHPGASAEAEAPKGELAAAAGDHAEAAAALEPDVAAAHEADQPAQPAASTTASTSAAPAAQAQAPIVRGSPETVANMAAQIVKKLDARSTRFDLELDPAGLGRVDVRVEINAHGRLSAAMSFDNPQSAAELKSRANELHKALEQAGFDMSGGMSFDVAGDQGRPGQGFAGQAGQDREPGAGSRGRAFKAALDTAGEADAAARPLNLRRGVSAGLDVRI